MSEAAYYEDLARRLGDLKEYTWARATLIGIANTIQQTGHLTLKQKEAIEHVLVGRLKHDVQAEP